MTTIKLAQEQQADDLLSRDLFALLTGMLLDQQFPMERAFSGPYRLLERMVRAGAIAPSAGGARLDPAAVAASDPVDFAAWMAGPPAVHRYHASMGARLRALAAAVAQDLDGDVSRLWSDPAPDGSPPTGLQVRQRLESLPGFGRQKASIFLALLGKQLGVTPPGWREAAGAYGEEGSYRSVADVRGPDSLEKVRETKRAAKAAKAAD